MKLEDIAYHEAGHAVIALHFGVAVTEATIVPSPTTCPYSGERAQAGGHVRFVWEDDTQLRSRRGGGHLASSRRLVILYAGVEAQTMRRGRTPRCTDWINAGRADINEAGYDLDIVASGDRRGEQERRLIRESRLLVRHFRPFIDVLANALLERVTLSGDEIRELLLNAPIDPSLRRHYFSTPDPELATHSWERCAA